MNKIQIIDVFGQFYDKGTDHYYTYSSPQLKEQVAWKRYINDPRVFLNGIGRAYSTWCTDEGWWISICIQPNPHDQRQGFAEIAFCLGAFRPVDGKEAVDLLNRAANFFVLSKPTLSGTDAKNFDKDLFWKDEDTDKWLMSNPIDLTPCTPHKSTLSGMLSNPAYRTYTSSDELESALTFISQQGYSDFSQIFIIPKESEPNVNAQSVDNIRVQKILFVKNSIDGRADKTQVNEGGTLTITFIKEGYTPQQISTHAINSHYGYVVGDTYYVNDANKAGIEFNKHIYIACQEKNGSCVDDADVYINGKRYNAASLRQDGIDIPESLQTLDVEVKSYNHNKERITIDNIVNGKSFPITLTRKGYSVVFVVDEYAFPSNKTVTAKSSEFYSLQKYDPEVYGDKITLYLHQSSKHSGKQTTLPSTIKGKKKHYRKLLPLLIKRGLQLLGILFAFWLIYAGYCLLDEYTRPWPFNGHKTDVPVDTANVTETETESSDTIGAYHDVMYLKQANTWNKSQLKSQKFMTLCDYIIKGQINEIVSQQWFDNPVNGYWHDNKGDGIFDILNVVVNDPTKRDIAPQILKDCSGNGQIQLSSLKNELQNLIKTEENRAEIPANNPSPTPPKSNPKVEKPKGSKPKKDQGKTSTQQVNESTENSSSRPSSH